MRKLTFFVLDKSNITIVNMVFLMTNIFYLFVINFKFINILINMYMNFSYVEKKFKLCVKNLMIKILCYKYWKQYEKIMALFGNCFLREFWKTVFKNGWDHYWWRLMEICILNRGTMISHEIETMCPLGWSKWLVIIKFVIAIISLM